MRASLQAFLNNCGIILVKYNFQHAVATFTIKSVDFAKKEDTGTMFMVASG